MTLKLFISILRKVNFFYCKNNSFCRVNVCNISLLVILVVMCFWYFSKCFACVVIVTPQTLEIVEDESKKPREQRNARRLKSGAEVQARTQARLPVLL